MSTPRVEGLAFLVAVGRLGRTRAPSGRVPPDRRSPALRSAQRRRPPDIVVANADNDSKSRAETRRNNNCQDVPDLVADRGGCTRVGMGRYSVIDSCCL
ncbi:hypothetical protein C8Q78DRAFT_6663 [Trametes maxima]|nr:hypothetical protein C8Q78DRAFT_6663 [Trametes maxima]